MKNADISLNSLAPALKKAWSLVKPYAGILLVVVFAIIYGFMILRINALSDAPVDSSDVLEAAESTPTPHIDAKSVEQLETLKDNSVNVQTLFEQSRQSPFQE